MKTIFLSGILFLFLSNIAAFAGDSTNHTESKRILCNACADSVYHNTIDYLQDNGYFIVSLEKLSGFIQAKIYIKNNKVMSAKVGERRTLNFIIRPATEKQSNITLNIYCEDLIFSGDMSNRVDYYEDKGISSDISLYKNVLDELEEYLTNN